MTPPPLDRAAEARRLLDLYRDRGQGALVELLERQFTVLHNRAQVLLGLSGVVITTTGFSGRLIAGTSRLAQCLIILGVGTTLVAAAVVVWGVLHLHWLTQQPGAAPEEWLDACLAYRDRKTRAYRLGIVLLMAGLATYVGAIGIMLLYPEAHAPGAVR
ncbi:MAG: hypothetical protein HY722_08075 [Planctomycetes bacterium]|nr:hypothetical protein [Planctomycetota bacterium]